MFPLELRHSDDRVAGVANSARKCSHLGNNMRLECAIVYIELVNQQFDKF